MALCRRCFGVLVLLGPTAVHAQQGVVTKESAFAPTVSTVDGSSTAVCDYDIHYNEWVPTFEPNEYEHNDNFGKVHCLEACCRDPKCTGLTLESALDSQCYKYDEVPKNLNKGRDLAQFLAGERSSEWSVFVKRVKQGQQPSMAHIGAPVPEGIGFVPHLSAELQQALVAMPHRSKTLASEEYALDRKLRDLAGSQFGECQWSVHYDTWLPSFDQGEYSHDDKFAGAHAHCLDQCCQDPTCAGLSLMSNELHQCYKYSSKPHGLKGHGRRLGDGHWLLRKKPTWSVMIKATHPAAHSQGAARAGALAQRRYDKEHAPASIAGPLLGTAPSMPGAAGDELTSAYVEAAAAVMQADRLTMEQQQRLQQMQHRQRSLRKLESSKQTDDDRGVLGSLADIFASDAAYHFRWIGLSAIVIALAMRALGDYSDTLARSIGLQRGKMELKHVPGAIDGASARKEKAPLLSGVSRGGIGAGLDTFGGTA